MKRQPLRPGRSRPDFRRRSSGVLLHVTSLPGPHGSGDLSAAAFRFVDFLAAAGQSWWQTLPVGPPGDPPGNSPYSSSSSIAGSPYLVSLEAVAQEGWLTRAEVAPAPGFDADRVRFPEVRAYREARLRRAWSRFRTARGAHPRDFRRFCAAQRDWLDDFALFCALKQRLAQAPWPEWPRALRERDADALIEVRRSAQDEFDYHRWVQYVFARQWTALRHYARRRGVGLIGDVPICVAHDSADVWAHPELFELDAGGWPTRVSGYPPDRCARRGQIWGHALCHWPAHRRTGFRWWIARLGGAFRLFDAVRLDHFLGFTRLWSVPASARTGARGHWVRSPGRALLAAVRRSLGEHPMIAEDLGHVTPADVVLRDAFGLPAMRVVHWGVGNGDPLHRPHRFGPHTVAYTGTHDTDTVAGWFAGLKARARQAVLDSLGGDGTAVAFDLTRLALHSSANTVIVPVPDLLGLGRIARMNRPGTPGGNWEWRLRAGALTARLARSLRRLTELTERLPSWGDSPEETTRGLRQQG